MKRKPTPSSASRVCARNGTQRRSVWRSCKIHLSKRNRSPALIPFWPALSIWRTSRTGGNAECAKLQPPNKMPAAHNQSGSFSGVWRIFLYNWHFYAAALVLDLIAAVFLVQFSPPAAVCFAVTLGAAISSFWALSSLLVSHYIYDCSRLYQWNWLAAVMKRNPVSWANIHAGLDQTSEALIRLFPAAQRRILDVYVPSEMSEPSIERARHHIGTAAASE